jgi:hypothetical protein
MANRTLTIIEDFGQIITTAYESPVNFFNMTLLTAPIPPLGKRDAGQLPLEIPGGLQY